MAFDPLPHGSIEQKSCTVAIIGGGPSGLALATELKRLGLSDIVVLERETEAGGIPRHCGHYPFGLFEFKRLMKGPDYARRLVQTALKAGVSLQTGTTVTALHPSGLLSLTTPDGISTLKADRVVLCTGVREATRSQRFIGGQRPQGVLSTGALQSMVYLHEQRPFRRPVILGTELVSFSAISTCRHLGIRPVAMIEEGERVTARRIFRPYPFIMNIPIRYGASKLHIIGDRQVEAVEWTDKSGSRHILETDGVIVSGKFRPEAALLAMSHLDVDPATGGPVVDQYGRSSDPAYYCTGNLLRPVEHSAWCWREGVETAHRIARDLSQPLASTPQPNSHAGARPVEITNSAIRFVMPQRISNSDAPDGMTHLQIRLARPVHGELTISAGGKTVWRGALKGRPERRILVPIAPLLTASDQQSFDLSLQETT